MELAKAIEIFTIELSAWPHKGTEDWYDAIKLGKEAMERINRLRSDKHCPPSKLLPSETPPEKVT